MDLSHLEDMLQKKLNKVFRNKKGGSLQPKEVMFKFKKELLNCRKNSKDNFVPNIYVFFMSPEDYHRLSSRRVINELYHFAEQSIVITDCLVEGKLQLKFCQDNSLINGDCITNSYYDNVDSTDDIDDFRTLIIDRDLLASESVFHSEKEFAALTVTEGVEKNFCVEFSMERINIGRKDTNDIILADPNVSRRHAYVLYENYRHVLYDANSLNGTYVNGKKIVSVVLQVGDEICVGNSVLVYDIF